MPSERSLSSGSSSSSSSAGVVSMSSISSMSELNERMDGQDDGNHSDLSSEFPTMKKLEKHNEFIQSKPKRNVTVPAATPKLKKKKTDA